MLTDALSASIRPRQFSACLFSAFGVSALVIVGTGILGLVAMTTNRRTREIGIRMALGARSTQVLTLVVRQGLRLVAIGLVIGVPAGLASARVLSSLLVGVAPNDPITYVGVVMVLAAAGAIAAWIPARRAAGVDPRIALSEGG